MNGRYLALAGRIKQELAELSDVADRTISIWRQYESTADTYLVDAVALNLHSFYSGLERLFEAIADTVDQAKPEGASWHVDLLRQMATEIPGIRPPVLSTTMRDRLDKYGGFRHVVRYVYAYDLDATQIEKLIEALLLTEQETATDLHRFAQFLEISARE